MPIYRKLHTKITDSFDVNDMPNDFYRLLWSWLPLVLCKEGRGVYHAGWIKSKAMPLREDVTNENILEAMEYFVDNRLIRRYEVDGREYFYIPTWHEYQNTSRDAPSPYPEPPEYDFTQEQVASKSGASPVKTRQDKIREEYDDPPAGSLEAAFVQASSINGLLPTPEKAIEAYKIMQKAGVEPQDVSNAVHILLQKKYTIVGPSSIVNTAITEMSRRKNTVPDRERAWSEVHE